MPKLTRHQVAEALREFLKKPAKPTLVDPEDVEFDLRVVAKYEALGTRGLESHEHLTFFELLERMIEWEE